MNLFVNGIIEAASNSIEVYNIKERNKSTCWSIYLNKINEAQWREYFLKYLLSKACRYFPIQPAPRSIVTSSDPKFSDPQSSDPQAPMYLQSVPAIVGVVSISRDPSPGPNLRPQ
jgi:hypothetical protein